ncbi:MAG: DUF294 nucleotidyltransferase-like domain-containing protein [Gammaproteobacteria bacterium]
MTADNTVTNIKTGAIPLVSLNLIAFDTETTGLDTSRARIIQLGAVKIERGQVDLARSFQQLVNPGEPIPAQSTTIHGIRDEDVAPARRFPEVEAEFSAWLGDSVLVGYACGFDLAMLKREHLLAGMDWLAPRTLDVRYLVNIIAPNLPDFSLDTITDWLGIEIHERHTALGDAVAAARVFLALLPRLRERDIRTLAEAERACQQFSQITANEVSLGWHEVHRSGEARKNSLSALARIDSYPYRHRLRDLMHSPAIFVDAREKLRDVLNTLIEHEISAVFVKPDADHGEPGIVTERDLLRTFNQGGIDAFELPVVQIAQYPLHSLSADAFVYRALARMKRKHFRHLGVHDSRGRIVGALSARDLLRQRADEALVLGDDIDQAEGAEAMAVVWGHIAEVAAGLNNEGVDARDIAAVISRELCALTRQACKNAEAEMLGQGLGPPPCDYAMLVLGSGGRGESLLAMDQDNAIVFEQGEPDGEQDRWFAELGSRVSHVLDVAGVPYCKGNIMASNADWRQSVASWQATIKTWINRQTPDDILNCDIFFDATCVHGSSDLANRVLDFAFEQGANSTSFIKLMSINACKDRSPLRLFGRYKLEEGRMDLKKGGIMPVFSTARVLAIQYRVGKQSTPDRLLAVRDERDSMLTTFDNLREAHRILFDTILQQQLLDLEAGIPPSNFVAPSAFSASRRKQLKWALEQVPNVSSLLGVPLSSIA